MTSQNDAITALADLCSADFQQIADATGLTVYMYDSAGHGLSGPSGPDDRGYVRSASELVTDLADFAEHVVSMRERELGDAGFICLAGYSMVSCTSRCRASCHITHTLTCCTPCMAHCKVASDSARGLGVHQHTAPGHA